MTKRSLSLLGCFVGCSVVFASGCTNGSMPVAEIEREPVTEEEPFEIAEWARARYPIDVPQWAQEMFPETGVDGPLEPGGPVFVGVDKLGEWHTETRVLQAYSIQRLIPEMLSPRGMGETLLLEWPSMREVSGWPLIDYSPDDLRYDPVSNSLRVGPSGLPIRLTDWAISDFENAKDRYDREYRADLKLGVLEQVLSLYLQLGRDAIASGSIEQFFEHRKRPYWMELPPRMLGWEMQPALPEQPTRITLYMPFMDEVYASTDTPRTIGSVADITADVYGGPGDEPCRVLFVVFGSQLDMDQVEAIAVSRVIPLEGIVQPRVVYKVLELSESVSD